MEKIYDYLSATLPKDHCRQIRALDLIEEYYATNPQPEQILDFGCGIGASLDFFSKNMANANWSGVDIEESPEVNARTRTDGSFFTYDGVNLPFEADAFDLIYSNQVLEHVRYLSLIHI